MLVHVLYAMIPYVTVRFVALWPMRVDLDASELLESVFLPVGGCSDARIAAFDWFEGNFLMVLKSSLPLCAMARSTSALRLAGSSPAG